MTILGDNSVAYGGDGGDRIFGWGDDNVLSGGDGSDRMYAEGDNNFLYGGNDDDVVSARKGTDNHLYGGAGNDELSAMAGDTEFTGGTGNDTFIIEGNSKLDVFVTITDFNPDEDAIQIGNDGAGTYVLSDISVIDWADGTGADVFVQGALVASVTGGQGMATTDIVLT